MDGQEKTWLERQEEYRAKFSALDDAKYTAGFLGLPVLVVGLFAAAIVAIAAVLF